jgi:hypothetical protein
MRLFHQGERKTMNNKFDELAKGLAQSVSRRQALKKFSIGVAGMGLAFFGLANRAEAQTACLPFGSACKHNSACCSGQCGFHLGGKLNAKVCA